MLLGKRSRKAMKRTTSLSDITIDSSFNGVYQNLNRREVKEKKNCNYVVSFNHHNHNGGFTEIDNFLSFCKLCKRRLAPGKDIYIYRGDSAFCSQECREKQMNIDERKDKFSTASKKKEAASTTSKASNGETVILAT